MTRSIDHDIILEGMTLEEAEPNDEPIDDEPTDDDIQEAPKERHSVPIRKPSGEGYGRPISTEPCSFCYGAGTVEKRRGKIMCLACDGIGTKGGAGKGRHPITLDIVRPYRTHMEEKPLED